MWSLPNIQKMNDEAVERWEKENKRSIKARLKGKTCEYCESKAEVLYDWYDVFGDEPKGEITLCAKHDGYYGNPAEGYFTCAACERVMVENYTWERYDTVDPDTGEQVCLNCALDAAIEDPEQWIRSAEGVTWERVRNSRHLIPVEGEHWKKHLDFLGNVEFDSMSGACISGGGVKWLKELVDRGIAQAGKAMLILDAGYQFAVSIGVYVPKQREVPGTEGQDREGYTDTQDRDDYTVDTEGEVVDMAVGG